MRIRGRGTWGVSRGAFGGGVHGVYLAAARAVARSGRRPALILSMCPLTDPFHQARERRWFDSADDGDWGPGQVQATARMSVAGLTLDVVSVPMAELVPAASQHCGTRARGGRAGGGFQIDRCVYFWLCRAQC